jgi:chromosome segregation ATPase
MKAKKTRAKNGRHSPTNTRAALEQRIAALDGFLEGRLADILRVRKERQESLQEYRRRMDSLQEAWEDRAVVQGARIAECQADIAETAEQITGLLEQVERLSSHLSDRRGDLRQHQDSWTEEDADYADAIVRLKKDFQPLRRHWSERLQEFQDGTSRRKRAERDKLKRRLDTKIERAKRRGEKSPTARDILFGEHQPKEFGTPQAPEEPQAPAPEE